MTAIWTASIGAVILAVISGAFGIVNSTRANRPAESNAQLAWVKQAHDDAAEARTDARTARTEVNSVRLENESIRRDHDGMRRDMAAMRDWMEAVVRARNAYVASADQDKLDTGAIRLIGAINGGPHLPSENAPARGTE